MLSSSCACFSPPRQNWRAPLVAVLLLVAAPGAGQTPAAQPPIRAQRTVVPVQGERFQAALVEVDDAWRIAFDAGGARRRLAASELVSWGAPLEPRELGLRESRERAWLLLVDGSLLVADRALSLDAEKGRLKIDTELFGAVDLPLAWVTGVVLHPPADLAERDHLIAGLASPSARCQEAGAGQPVSAARNADRLLLENGDELGGTIQGIDAETVRFDGPVGPADVPLERIVGLAFNPSLLAGVRGSGLRALVGTADGSLLVVTSLVVDERQARISLGGSLTLATSPEAGTDAIVSLQVLGGGVAYLSDMKAESYKHVPYLELGWPYHRDANATGGRLRAGGRLYAKGLGMHSAGRLTYGLDKSSRFFAAELAIDDATEGGGSVVFRVFVDEREVYKSPVVRGGDPPLPISVDVSGGRRLSLIVDYADRADELDHADWLDARLSGE